MNFFYSLKVVEDEPGKLTESQAKHLQWDV
jgi:hypothetical protein